MELEVAKRRAWTISIREQEELTFFVASAISCLL